ncbi:MAG: response regulator [Deltaproteobacteria bacterium]|nr:MAG: response regulator [Deltaproteobacteria bacterium]
MPKKILLAEDSITIRKVFELAFAQSDFAITAVDNGEDAVRLAGEMMPDLVVADITLPGRDGYGVAAELQASAATSRIPVLILSGTIVPIDEGRLRECGAKGVLFKPFETRELMGKVDAALTAPIEAPRAATPQEPPPGDEHWDFSDVLEEVEDEAGKPDAAAPARSREEILPGALLPGEPKGTPIQFKEFDVSIDDIEEPPPAPAPPPPVSAPPPVEAPAIRSIPPEESHLEGSIAGDAPPAVTDLTEAMEGHGEIEEIVDLEDIFHETPASVPEVPISPVAAPAAEPSTGTAAEEGGIPSLLREQFAARAEEIFRSVASEAVEKVVWELTDRLTAEFSAKIRESVEAVAWEVIPATAEALIREEIERIRAQAAKPSP